MLSYLKVVNFGIIETLEIEPHAGLNVITGETGAGKTLIIDALSFLTTQKKASQYQIRDGAEFASVEAIIDLEDKQLTFARILKSDGRSRCYLNGNIVPLSELAETASTFVDINAQDITSKLFTTAFQTQLVDGFGHIDTSLVSSLKHEIKQLKSYLEKASNDNSIHSELERMNYELSLIDAANIQDPNELISLKEQEAHLIKISQEKELTDSIINKIDEAQIIISDVLRLAIKHNLDPDTISTLEKIQFLTEELGDGLRQNSLDEKEVAEKLNLIEERKARLSELTRRFGGQLNDVIKHRDYLQHEIKQLRDLIENIKEINQKINQKSLELAKETQELNLKRKNAANKLAQKVNENLKLLGMSHAVFDIKVSDDCEFYFSATGKNLKKLSQVASGGELSRVMLAIALSYPLKKCLAFDEIDRGIGGKTALEVSKLLKATSKNAQVFVVTHLAQIAAFADMHIVVDKYNGSVKVNILHSLDERVNEIARMLSGFQDSELAKNHAKELIEMAGFQENK